MGNSIDFRLVAERALSAVDSVLARWLPNGKRQGGEYVVTNPTRADNSPGSFSVNLASGKWADFAEDSKGGDLVSLIAYLEGVSQKEAAQILADFLNLDISATSAPQKPAGKAKAKPAKYTWTAMLPVPEAGLASIPSEHSSLGKPSAVWEYLNGTGALMMKVFRFDKGGASNRSKEYRPLCWCQGSDGKQRWRWQQPADNRPLYGLDRLAWVTGKPVLLVEGEKACDAAIGLFSDVVVLSWPGGSKALGKVDFKSLGGREVWYWPDNDKAGAESVPVLRNHLEQAGIKSLQVFNLRAFEATPKTENGKPVLIAGGEWPDKADAADAVEMGWTADHIELLKSDGVLFEVELASPPSEQEQLPAGEPEAFHGFKIVDGGVYFFDGKAKSYKFLCSKLEQLAWARLLKFTDLDYIEKEWVAPNRLFATDGGSEVVRELADRGLNASMNRNSKSKLLEYINTLNPTERVRLAYKMGWHGDSFMLPYGVVGTSSETLRYYSEDSQRCKMKQAGTLEEWRGGVAKYAAGNPLVAFMMSVAFTAPLLEIMGMETSGFHIYSDSSDGKTTTLTAASSVLGQGEGYGYKWRATDNALEGIAASHSDCLLVLDEIGQANDRLIGETVMMLGNGLGKSRANERGGVQGNQHQWRLAYLSSGEQTLAGKMSEAGLKTKAGMEVRLLNIPVRLHLDGVESYGVFNELHGFSSGADLSDQFKSAANKFYGTAFPAFIAKLIENLDREKLIAWLSQKQAEFAQYHVSDTTGGQVRRAADKFALVGAAGELATKWGITGWEKGEALRAADNCFKRWLNDRGGEGNLEDKQILQQVRLFFEREGESGFTRWDLDDAKVDEHTPRTMKRYGFRKTESETDQLLGVTTESVYYTLPESFRTEICKGYDPKRVARLLRDHGALVCDTEKNGSRLQRSVRLPGMGKHPTKCYVIKHSALYGGGGV